MNIYLYEATNTNQYFPDQYLSQLLERIWDFTSPAKVFDLLDDDYLEDSLFIITGGMFIKEFSFILNDHKIQKFKNISNKKILIDCTSQTFLTHHAQHWVQDFHKIFFEFTGFEPKNIYYITQTKKDCDIIKKILGNSINVCDYDRWMQELYEFLIRHIFQNKHNYLSISNNLPKKKFSIFIRRFEDIRLHVFCELIRKDLLHEFYYTFCAESKTYESQDIMSAKVANYINDLPDYFTDDNKRLITDWAKSIPYKFDELIEHDYGDFYSRNLGPYYNSSDIHLVVESHVDCDSMSGTWSSLTEKTYKAMLYKKPFIIFSQKGNLQYLRDCGYKTFSPFIDESYDEIEDSKERLIAIVEELDRIKNLTPDVYNKLLHDSKNVVEYNYALLLQNVNKTIPDNFLIKNMVFT